MNDKFFQSVDGNTAAAIASYNYTEIAAIYPITPSSTMAELVDLYSSKNMKNFFDARVKVVEMQSEAGAAGAVHGALQGGAFATTYTASQGLLLMLPNIYKWVGELLPAVIHVSARSIAARSLSIFGDHQDIYAVRQTGVTMICAHSVQEVADLSNVAHLIAMKSQAPIIHFFDGFRTSHEIQNVEFINKDIWKTLLPKEEMDIYRKRALNPHGHAVTRGGAENDDVSFQGKEAQNSHYQKVLDVAVDYFEKTSELTGRKYAPFVYVGPSDATKVIIAMGSVTETIQEVINDLNAKGQKVGLVKVHLYRPFSTKHLIDVIPSSVQKIAVLDRTKEMGSVGEPLYLDVVASANKEGRFFQTIVGGRYGISSKDTQPKHIKAVYDFLDNNPFSGFTVGIDDDVTHFSIPFDNEYHIESSATACLFYGLGSDGTVSANKSSIKIIGDMTKQFAQAYFAYDSRKAGGPTRSYLRFGREVIRSTYYVEKADFISCSQESFIFKYDMLRNIKKGGTFLLNSEMEEQELLEILPKRVKYALAKKEVKFYLINANKIARELGLGRHTNTILQSSFFYLNQGIMPYEKASDLMKRYARITYGKKGDEIVSSNIKAIELGFEGLKQVVVDKNWINTPPTSDFVLTGDKYFDKYVTPMDNMEGNDLPTSTFLDHELLDGTMNNNITFKQKRKIADQVPHWIKENCIQCNTCALVCPHATIRPFLMSEEELKNAPEVGRDDVSPAIGGPKVATMKYRIAVSPMDCVGCGLCVTVCPGKGGKKALEMVESRSEYHLQDAADYAYKEVSFKKDIFPLTSPKGVGFLMPYMEVSGACAGCGETPYYKLVSQLFGQDMLVANATGCSSIYCGSVPGTPFVSDKNGNGIAWANSLFEDNAEFGLGMRLASDYKLSQIADILTANVEDVESELKALIELYLANIKDREIARPLISPLLSMIKNSSNEKVKEALKFEKDFLDKSVWIIGGDGWAYDIGYGGLDHVLASGENVNILVLDTEVYSNTGGQASKSTQTGAIAKFAASGKTGVKKNLALMAMAYGDVYVAQVSLGANPVSTIKALTEAEAYNGPSLIIAYSPCVEHGIKGGLSNHYQTEKDAVTSGYWPIFRYNPLLEKEGKSPLVVDMKEPNYAEFRNFVLSETRFSQLFNVNKDNAEVLLNKAEVEAKKRFERIKRFG